MLVQAIIEAMVGQIDKYGFSVLEEYPKMVNVTDRAYLEANARPGRKFAWVLTDFSSDFVELGSSEVDNDMIEFFGDTPGDVKFYQLDIAAANSFHLFEIDRKTFNRLPMMNPIKRRTTLECTTGQLVLRSLENGPVRVTLTYAPSEQTVNTHAPTGNVTDAMSLTRRIIKR